MTQHPPVCYEIFVRSFCDSNGDGIGDLNGVRSRLGYLSELGIGAIWLTPVHPSPSYHKYDITDYYAIDPEYGTLADFQELICEAHRLGIKVYMDLVIHHTSIRHKWFRSAKCNPDSSKRHYYRWMSETEISESGLDVRESTQDAHTVNPWHKVKGDSERYLGVFSREMADLNFDNEALSAEIYKIADFWLSNIGVDGFRLDAARHIYPVWEDERNPVFWKEFGATIAGLKPDAFLIGEVWADTAHVAPYFAGLHANFNFDLWQKIEGMLTHGRHDGLTHWLISQREAYAAVSESFVDATMLSNHDQQRIGSTLKGRREKMKLAAAILLTLPGQPYLYYGEEIGMLGKKPDPYLREPFLWGDESIETYWKEPRHSTRARVRTLREAMADPGSLYYCYKTLIALRSRFDAIGAVHYNHIEPVDDLPDEVLAFVRRGEENRFLILHNLSGKNISLPLPDEFRDSPVIRYATRADYKLEHGNVKLGGLNSLILHLENV